MRSKKPRGSWVGKVGWHPQVDIVAPPGSTEPTPGTRVAVDEELAPVLLALWRLGFPTAASCQNAPTPDDTESGEAHVHFQTVASAKRFAALVGTVVVYRPMSSGASVAFPTQRLPEIASLLGDYRFAVAVHEAGHGVVAGYFRFDVREIRLRRVGGHAKVAAHIGVRIEWLAYWLAGEIAVEEICGGYRLPVDPNPNSDKARFQQEVKTHSATEYEQSQAHSQAREIVRGQRAHVITIANAVLAAEDGRLVGEELDRLLRPVWAAS